jgi:glycosyltransferase involved in cell wall biosynthesis
MEGLMQDSASQISVIIPIYNEQDNLSDLFDKLGISLDKIGLDYEIIAVDDGSTDDSRIRLEDIAAEDSRVRLIFFRRNFGQTAAVAAGIDQATGDIIVLIDADLQNDPEDIKTLLDKLNEGYDVVSGWRRDRKDPFLNRRLPSMIANRLISFATGTRLHDYGCTLKAYRAEVIKGIRLYGEMHRFIPEIVSWSGARIAEVPVLHHPRTRGKTKYGIWRTFKVILDLITVVFLGQYGRTPMYFFGAMAFFTVCGAILSGIVVLYRKIFLDLSMIESPLLLLTALLIILSVIFISIGLLSELLVRIYYESQGKTTYVIEKTSNLNKDNKTVKI